MAFVQRVNLARFDAEFTQVFERELGRMIAGLHVNPGAALDDGAVE